jgi:hypothetical protein
LAVLVLAAAGGSGGCAAPAQAPTYGTVTGSVLSAKPVGTVLVTLVPEGTPAVDPTASVPVRTASLNILADGRFDVALAVATPEGGLTVLNSTDQAWTVRVSAPAAAAAGAPVPTTVPPRERRRLPLPTGPGGERTGPREVIATAPTGEVRATVQVVDSPFFDVVTGGATFRFERVPPGRYSLLARSADLTGRSPADTPLTVNAGDTVRRDVVLGGAGAGR